MFNEYKFRVSVIIPIYNSAKFLRGCVDSVLKEQGDIHDVEILLINDGSKDDSLEICREYERNFSNVRVISKKNEGLSATRNRGIRESNGRYFLFLDSDDQLLPHTIKPVADFFDAHYDEIDLVTYPQVDILRDGSRHEHFRYKILKESGVYDLEEYPFITQTRVNVLSKNKGEANVLFDETPGFRHEDSCYNAYVLMDKMKIGFCNKGGYLYVLNDTNITAQYFHAYYIFESSMRYYENLFHVYDLKPVPPYIQSLVLNDLSWKLKANKLLPFHYDDEAYQQALERVRALICRMDDDVILRHPSVSLYHRYYFLSLKDSSYEIRTTSETKKHAFPHCSETFALFHGEEELRFWHKLDINIQQFHIEGNRLTIVAALRHPAVIFMKPKVMVMENGDSSTYRELSTTKSTYNYINTKVQVTDIRRFVYTCDITKTKTIQFFGDLDGNVFQTYFTFTQNMPFTKSRFKNYMIKDGYCYRMHADRLSIQALGPVKLGAMVLAENIFYLFRRPRVWRDRLSMTRNQPKEEIWLYNDCNKTMDNGYYQFVHDFAINDGVTRYYVYDDELENVESHFTEEQKKYLVRFGSREHYRLFGRAGKVLTAFVGIDYYCPYPRRLRKHYLDLCHYELVYLQHGILHATLPWQYGNDRLAIDKVVVSSHFEIENMQKKYFFLPEQLVPSGMARLDYIDREAAPKNRILLAPSWRYYLIGDIKDGRWTPWHDLFQKSVFFQKYEELFHNEELIRLLEENDYYLDFKLHPIFSDYKKHYSFGSSRIGFAAPEVKLEEYRVCITDFSSFVFDFVYCKKPVLYFMPDYTMFLSGMHTYRQLDIPLEDGFGKLAMEPEDLVQNIRELMENHFEIPEEYQAKTQDFFTRYDSHAQKTYEAIKGKSI